MLVLSRGQGEAIMIGHDIKITVLAVSGDVTRIGIDAPSDVDVHRQEIYLEIENVNMQAAASSSATRSS